MKDFTMVLMLAGLGLFAFQNYSLREQVSGITIVDQSQLQAEANEAFSRQLAEARRAHHQQLAEKNVEIQKLTQKVERAKDYLNQMAEEYKFIAAENRRLCEVINRADGLQPDGPTLIGTTTGLRSPRRRTRSCTGTKNVTVRR